jgi:hypothetical protein
MKNRRVVAALAVGLVSCAGVAVALGAQGDTSQQNFRAGFGVLKGTNEVGDGDRNGRGSFTGILDGNRLCYGVTVTNIADPIAAHIHRGARTQNGGVVVTLKHPRNGDPGARSGCTNVSSSLADELRSNPNRFYVNVHNTPFPDGAVRGQLFNDAG